MRWSWARLNKRSAPGIDRITAWEYGENLESNIAKLVESVKGGWYRAKLILRRFIPKLGGKLRPLGIPVTNDKLLQMAVTAILEAIYEAIFLPCRYRYADDFVCAFHYEDDARRFYKALGLRLGKYGLEVAEEKTRIIRFSRWHLEDDTWFEFLGFEFRWGTNRAGNPKIQRRTSRKKLRNLLKIFTEWCKTNRNMKMTELMYRLNFKLRGYYNYYGVRGNYDSLKLFFEEAKKILFKWLNRRSQRKSYTWETYMKVLKYFRIERPRITERKQMRQLSLINNAA